MVDHNFLNTADDMEWLFSTHAGIDLMISWKPRSARIIGNMDDPDEIHLYPRKNPLHTDTPLIGTRYTPNCDGNRTIAGDYQFCGPLTATEALRIDAEELASEALSSGEIINALSDKPNTFGPPRS
jgi:hypothetical protein